MNVIMYISRLSQFQAINNFFLESESADPMRDGEAREGRDHDNGGGSRGDHKAGGW